MNEHDPEEDQAFPEVEGRLRALGSAPLLGDVADRTLARLRSIGRPRMSGTRFKLVSAAAIAGFVAGGVGLAAAAVLPAPVQDVAHSALDAVGVHVPPGHVRYNDPTVCPGGPYANHGAYVRSHKDDPNAGKSPCGKPVQAVDPSGKTTGTENNDPADKNDKDKASKGHGPPPWAHGHGKPDKSAPAANGATPTTRPATPSSTSSGPTTTAATASTTTTSTSTSTSSTTPTTVQP